MPGKNPDVDPWHFEGGPVGFAPFQCSPQRREEGWELDQCTNFAGAAEDATFQAFVPAQGDSRIEVTLQHRQTRFPTVYLTRVRQRDEPQASDNVSLIWHQPGDGIHSDIWADDGLIFAPHFSDRHIEILDASTGRILSIASVPEAEGEEPEFVFDVKARDGLLYAATHSNGLVIFDVSDPTSPKLIGQYRVFVDDRAPANFTNIHNIFLSPDGNYVYAINISFRETDLRIIDVSNPTSPKEAGRFALGTEVDYGDIRKINVVHDINVINHDGRLIAFLNYAAAGLYILDVTDPASISVLSSIEWDGIFSHSGWPFTLDGKLYYAHASEGYDRPLTILDVTDLKNPRVVSRFGTRAGLSVHNVEVVDGIAYIAYYIDGLRVVDLRDPENPSEIGHFDTVPAQEERDIIQGLWGVRVLDGVAYVSDFETGTYALQVDLK